MIGQLGGQAAIVTGGGSGIGRATCLALARAGAHVVAVGRNPDRLAETVRLALESTERLGTRVLSLPLDVQSEADMRRLAESTLEAFGRIDILVCSAGVVRPPGTRLQAVAQTPAADFDLVLHTNLKGIFLSNRAVLPAMLRQGSGNIVNISSTSGLSGIAFDGPYCASKFGVIGLSEALAEEVGPEGVRVQVLLPGPFETEMWNQAPPGLRPGGAGGLPPGGRVAETIVYLLTLPADTRLVVPIVQPRALPLGSSVGGTWSLKSRQAAASSSAVPEWQAAPAWGYFPDQVREDGRLRGKVVVVTGGASGLGLAACKRLAEEGAAVVVADAESSQPERVATRLPAPQSHLAFSLDPFRAVSYQDLVETAAARFGRIDALVTCAGPDSRRGQSVTETTVTDWEATMAAQLKTVYLSNRAILPVLIRQRAGTILNVASTRALRGRAFGGASCAAMFGVLGLSQSVQEEVRTYGVKVQALLPDESFALAGEGPDSGAADLPSDHVAEVIAFTLAQPADTLLTGAVIAPLGARRRRPRDKAAAQSDPAS